MCRQNSLPPWQQARHSWTPPLLSSHFLLQGSTSWGYHSLPQRVPPLGTQVFRYRILWRCWPCKPQRHYISYLFSYFWIVFACTLLRIFAPMLMTCPLAFCLVLPLVLWLFDIMMALGWYWTQNEPFFNQYFQNWRHLGLKCIDLKHKFRVYLFVTYLFKSPISLQVRFGRLWPRNLFISFKLHDFPHITIFILQVFHCYEWGSHSLFHL